MARTGTSIPPPSQARDASRISVDSGLYADIRITREINIPGRAGPRFVDARVGGSSSSMTRVKRSGTRGSVCGVSRGICERERITDGLYVIGPRSYKGPHVRLGNLIPDHVACIEVSTFAHRLEGTLVVQKLSCSICNGGRVIEGNARPPRPSAKTSVAYQYGVEMIAFPLPMAYSAA